MLLDEYYRADPELRDVWIALPGTGRAQILQWDARLTTKGELQKLAEGFGLKGYRCTNLPEFQAAFADALKQKGPTWIECIIDKDEKVLPMIPGGGDINDIIME